MTRSVAFEILHDSRHMTDTVYRKYIYIIAQIYLYIDIIYMCILLLYTFTYTTYILLIRVILVYIAIFNIAISQYSHELQKLIYVYDIFFKFTMLVLFSLIVILQVY